MTHVPYPGCYCADCVEGTPSMNLYEVHFRPAKRYIRGVHQPDISYAVAAETEADAARKATRMIGNEHPGYLRSKVRLATVEVASRD